MKMAILRLIILMVIVLVGCSKDSSPKLFNDIIYLKKELANGSKVRLFIVAVTLKEDSPQWSEMAIYASRKMHTDRGSTVVYFFDSESNVPAQARFDITNPFNESYYEHCIARFVRWPNGSTDFFKYPYK